MVPFEQGFPEFNHFKRVDDARRPPPRLNTKSTRASNCPCLVSGTFTSREKYALCNCNVDRPLLKSVRYTFGMTVDKILASIDSEIAQLKQARALLSGGGTKKTAPSAAQKKRRLSAAARKKIADAQRKRWAKQKAAK
jgi:hypothetical protein